MPKSLPPLCVRYWTLSRDLLSPSAFMLETNYVHLVDMYRKTNGIRLSSKLYKTCNEGVIARERDSS